MAEAVITGASSGIGAVYAERLAARGYDVVLIGRSAERLGEIAARLKRVSASGVRAVCADLATREGIRVAEECLAGSQVDLLINNAGVGARGRLLDEDGEQIDAMLATNVAAFTHLAVACARRFVARGGGTIVNISSSLALCPEAGNAVYSATKAYVLAFSQSLRAECGAMGLRVQAVLPGATRTPIYAAAGRDISTIDPAKLMDVESLVDAALSGLDSGEDVTVPSLSAIEDWQAYEEARTRLAPHLSARSPASRYQVQARSA